MLEGWDIFHLNGGIHYSPKNITMNKYVSNLFMSIRLHWYSRQRNRFVTAYVDTSKKLLLHLPLCLYAWFQQNPINNIMNGDAVSDTSGTAQLQLCAFLLCAESFWTSQTCLKGINQSVNFLQSFQFQKFYDASEMRRKRRLLALMCHAPNTLSSFLDFFKGENQMSRNNWSYRKLARRP